MTHFKNSDIPGTATLELLEIASPDLQTMPLAGGNGGGYHDHVQGAALFYPGYHMEWLIETYWRDSPIYPDVSEPSTDFEGVDADGCRLPITWGSSSTK